MLRRAVLAAVTLAGLVLPSAVAAPRPQVRGVAVVDVRVKVTAVSAVRVAGSATFTGRTRAGRAFGGRGTITLGGRRFADGRFRTNGTGSLVFTARIGTGSRSVRVTNGRGTLRFIGESTDGVGMVIDGATLTYIGGHTEGTGI
ncbi:MAG: hypothetical protein AB1416_14515 [Actinomycetota bacterium]